MLFRREHIERILSGRKTATRRDWKSAQARAGGEYAVQERMFQRTADCPARIRVTTMYRQALREMTIEDVRKEGYDTFEQFRAVWEDINGEWDPDLIVWVVEFELVEEPEYTAKTEEHEEAASADTAAMLRSEPRM